MSHTPPHFNSWFSPQQNSANTQGRYVHIDSMRGYFPGTASDTTGPTTIPTFACGCGSCHAVSAGQIESLLSAPSAGLSGTPTIAATSYNMPATGLIAVDGILSGVKWSTPQLTYSFPDTSNLYEYSGERSSGFSSLNTDQQNAVKSIFAHYSSVANLTFTEITETTSSHATLRFGESSRPATAYAYYPSMAAQGGDVWFNGNKGWYDHPTQGDYSYLTFLHEIGHALGLKHAQEATVYGALPTSLNSMSSSIMSYLSYAGSATTTHYTNASSSFAQTLMSSDILALQEMYGANYSSNATDTVYKWLPNSGQTLINGISQGPVAGDVIFETIWDGGGYDTYDFSAFSTDQTINLKPGAWSTASAGQLANLSGDSAVLAPGNVANAHLFRGDLRSLIESAIAGSGNDTLYGSDADNALFGNSGNDIIYGDSGNDRLDGGAGSDQLIGGLGDDLFYLTLNDLRQAAIGSTDIISDDGGIDRIVLGTGLSKNDVRLEIVGNDLVVSIADALSASRHDELIIRDWTTSPSKWVETIIFADGTSISIADELANQTLANIGIAPPSSDVGGGGGARVLEVTEVSHSIWRDSGSGSIQSPMVEPTGGAGAYHTTAYLNEPALITGTSQEDYLVGSAGNDTLRGGASDDLLRVQLGDDIFVGGTNGFRGDTLIFTYAHWWSGVTIDLGYAGGQKTFGGTVKISEIENLIGTQAADRFIGTETSNRLAGNSGDDILSMSRTAAPEHIDWFDGGDGNDTADFSLFSSAVWINLGFSGIESWTRDNHDVQSGSWRKLADLFSTENLVGTSYADYLQGDANGNILTGGTGRDILIGGDGADIFDFNAITDSGIGAALRDYISDFSQSAGDRIDVSTLDANTDLTGNQAFTLLTADGAEFTGIAGQLRWYKFNGDIIVEGNVNADNVADFSIMLAGISTLGYADFLV